MNEKDANQLNPLSLAFLGDAVFTLYIREYVLARHDCKSGALHQKASKFVCAEAQAKMLDALGDELNETEREIARRSRNCHNNTKAKNASLSVYKKATSLEGVLGYLWISDKRDRAMELMQKCVEIFEGGVESNE